MLEEEKLLTDVNKGRMASALYPTLSPILEEVRDNALARMKQLYRDGKGTEANLLASVAELCTLDDIELKFKSKIRKGEKALGELNGRSE